MKAGSKTRSCRNLDNTNCGHRGNEPNGMSEYGGVQGREQSTVTQIPNSKATAKVCQPV